MSEEKTGAKQAPTVIPEGWESRKVEDIGQVITGKTPSTKEEKYWGPGYPFVTPSDIADFDVRYNYDAERELTEEWLEIAKNYLLPKNAVCFVSIGSTIGKMCLLKEPSFTNQQINSVIINENNDSMFIFYFLRRQQKDIRSTFGGGGAAKDIINKSTFEKIDLILPIRKEEQSSIAKILSDLDSKIELNQQMNKTLEGIGQAIFERWFVDFEFPNEKGKPYKSSGGEMVYNEFGKEILSGWKIVAITEVAKIVDCLHSKKPHQTETGPILLQVFNIGQNGILDLSECYNVSEEDYRFWTRNIEAKGGDCVITNAGRVGAVAQIPEGFRFGIGRNMTAIRPVEIPPTYLIDYLLSEYGASEIQNNVDTGTILDSLNVKGIIKMRVLLPLRPVLDQYENLARPLRKHIEININQTRTLSEVRDRLLPKLMSGKIRIPVPKQKAEGCDV